jgi:hypothetical protein
VLLAIELFAVVYACFLIWFWSLCRVSARRERSIAADLPPHSNLIPFERGLQLSVRKSIRG